MHVYIRDVHSIHGVFMCGLSIHIYVWCALIHGMCKCGISMNAVMCAHTHVHIWGDCIYVYVMCAQTWCVSIWDKCIGVWCVFLCGMCTHVCDVCSCFMFGHTCISCAHLCDYIYVW